MQFFILSIVFFALVFQNIGIKLFTEKYKKSEKDTLIFNGMYFFVAFLIAIIFILISGQSLLVEPLTLILGIIFGIFFASTIIVYSKSLQLGPMSLSTLFMSMSLILPLLFSIVFMSESLTTINVIGVLLVFCTFLLSTQFNIEGRLSIKWFAYSVLTLLCNGTLSILLKIQQTTLPSEQLKPFFAIGYGCAALTIIILYSKQKKVDKPINFKSSNILLLIFLTGLSSYMGNSLVATLLDSIPAVVLFPIVNGGIVVIASIASILLFKEKLDLKGVLRLILGIAAVVLLSV